MKTHRIVIGRMIAIVLVIVLAITGAMTLPQAWAQVEDTATNDKQVTDEVTPKEKVEDEKPVSAEIPDIPPRPQADDPEVAMLSTMDAEKAVAESRTLAAPAEANVPSVRMSLDLLWDGTGHGTESQTFINSENGYAPGDNTPNDGYVATNDVVSYVFSMGFNPGPERTVDVQIPDTEYLKGATDFCTSGPGYSARPTPSTRTCSFTLQHGANGDMTRQLSVNSVSGSKAISEPQYLTAKTSIGDIVSDPVTVISAPREDVRVKAKSPINADTGVGTIEISSYFARTPGWSDEKGRATPNETEVVDLDVSSFPSGTKFNNREADSNGIITGLPTNALITVRIPPEALPNDVATAGEFTYHINVADGALDKGDAQNFADGKEPGSNKPQDYSTSDPEQGTVSGAYYANNNYGRIGWIKRSPGVVTSKDLYGPIVDRTLFTEGSRAFSSRDSRELSNDYGAAADTQTRAEIAVNLDRVDNGANVNRIAIADAWDKNEQMIDVDRLDELIPTWGGTVDPTHRIYYTTKNVLNEVNGVTVANNFGDVRDGTWTTTMPAVKDITAVAVETNRPSGLIGTMNVKIRVPLKTLSESEYESNSISDGDTFADFYTSSFNGGQFGTTNVRSFRYHEPSQPRPRVVHEVTGSPSNGALQTWIVSPQAYDYQDPENETFSPRVSVLLDKCIHSITVPDTVKEHYDVSYSGATPGSNCGNPTGEESRVLFTAKAPFSSNKTSRFFEESYRASVESLVLPEIRYTGRISASAPNREAAYPISNTASMTLLEQEPGIGAATSTTTQALMISTDNASIKEVDAAKVEVGKNIGWTLIAYNRGGTVAGDTRFVDVLPYQDSDVEGYNGEKNNFNGTLRLIEAKVLTADSAPGTKIQYTNRDPRLIDQDNPDDTATQWYDNVSSIGGNANVTAIRVTIPNFGADGSLAATVKIDAYPQGAQAGDIFVNKMGKMISENNNFGLESGAVVTEIVDSSIAGVVWWDEDNDSRYTVDEPGIEGVNVSLRSNSGNTTKTTRTDNQGRYLFENLTSGNYTVSIERGNGNSLRVPLTVETQYGKTEDIVQTYSYDNARFGRSSNISDVLLPFDSSVGNADFGFYRPAPSLKIDKEITGMPVENEDDPTKVDLTYTVSVANDGNAPSQNTVLTDVAESEQNIHDEMSSLLNAKGRKLVQLAFGSGVYRTSYALDNQGQVWTWGGGSDGQLGLGPDVTRSLDPTRVLGGDQGQEFLSDIVSVSAHSGYVLAIDREGQVWSWGQNTTSGILGIGEGKDSTDPMKYSLPKRVKGGEQGGEFLQDVVSVGLLGGSAHALTSDGSVWSWGSNQYGSLGVGKNRSEFNSSFVPVRVVGGDQNGQYLTGVTKIEVGSGRIGVIDNQSRVFMWGENNSGASGNGGYTIPGDDDQDNAPTRVLGGEQGGQYLTNIIDLGMTQDGTLFLDSNGNVWAAGLPSEIGMKHTLNGRVVNPVRVLGGEQGGEYLTDIKSVDGGNKYLYALGKNGDVFVAGWSIGNLNPSGSGEKDNPVFTRVLGGHKGGEYLTGIDTLVGYQDKMVVIDSNGISYGWGNNSSGYYNGRGSLGVDDEASGIPEPHRITIFDSVNILNPDKSIIQPVSSNTANGRTSRVYDLGTIPAGQLTKITMEATVDGKDVEQFLTNQVYVRSDFTPTNEPNPTRPTAYTSLAQHNANPEMINVNSSAVPNIGWEDDTDRVDQVPVYIPVTGVDMSTYSQSSGRLWNDLNKNGLIDDDEPGMPGEMVVAYVKGLRDDKSNIAGTVFTDQDGRWSMELKDGLPYIIEYPKNPMIGDKLSTPTEAGVGSDTALNSRGYYSDIGVVTEDVNNVNYGVYLAPPNVSLAIYHDPTTESIAVPGGTFTTDFLVGLVNGDINEVDIPSVINSFDLPDYTTVEKIVIKDGETGDVIGESQGNSDSIVIEYADNKLEPYSYNILTMTLTARIAADAPDTDAVNDSFLCSTNNGGIRSTIGFSGSAQEGFDTDKTDNTACADVTVVRPGMDFTKSINGNDANSALMAVDLSRNDDTMDISFSVTNDGDIDLGYIKIIDQILEGDLVSEDINNAIESEIRFQGYGDGIIESLPVGETVEITLKDIPAPSPGTFHGDEATATGDFSNTLVGAGSVSAKDQAWAFTYPLSVFPNTGGSGVLAGLLLGLIVITLGAGSYVIIRRKKN